MWRQDFNIAFGYVVLRVKLFMYSNYGCDLSKHLVLSISGIRTEKLVCKMQETGCKDAK